MISARGYATHGPQSRLRAFAFEREEPRERDVQIQVLFCGVCHSDIHQAKNEWSNPVYRSLNLAVSFPAVRSLTPLSLADP